MPPGPRSARAGTDTGGEPAASDATEGPELDYRFTLAGERTFLAWIRTALGLLAGGVAVHELVQPFGHHDIRSALAISCIVLAAVIALGALGRWRMVGTAMREGRPLPHTVMVPILAIGIAVIAVLAGIGLLLS
ncbi:YidH family protein [Nocardia nova]|uniref:YidH family protein n=1 Tax=Nocardia nova TaxID=37330 RepID=UPI00371C3E42